MSYKFGTERFQTKLIESAKDGKRAILLYENNSQYFEIKEYIGVVTKIIEKGNQNQISKLEILFNDNKKIITVGFIDNLVEEGSLVSVQGYFTDFPYSGIQFHCKAGINGIILNANETEYKNGFNDYKTYRIGVIFELSKVEISPIHTDKEDIKPMDGLTNFYYLVEDIQNEEEKTNNFINNITQRTFKKSRVRYSDPNVEDYPDFNEEEVEIEKNKKLTLNNLIENGVSSIEN